VSVSGYGSLHRCGTRIHGSEAQRSALFTRAQRSIETPPQAFCIAVTVAWSSSTPTDRTITLVEETLILVLDSAVEFYFGTTQLERLHNGMVHSKNKRLKRSCDWCCPKPQSRVSQSAMSTTIFVLCCWSEPPSSHRGGFALDVLLPCMLLNGRLILSIPLQHPGHFQPCVEARSTQADQEGARSRDRSKTLTGVKALKQCLSA
jgi:hypothetical protein